MVGNRHNWRLQNKAATRESAEPHERAAPDESTGKWEPAA